MFSGNNHNQARVSNIITSVVHGGSCNPICVIVKLFMKWYDGLIDDTAGYLSLIIDGL